MKSIFWLCLLGLVACTPTLPNAANLTAVTAIPTLDRGDPAALCDAATEYENRDWQITIEALTLLYEQGIICTGREAISQRLYTAYLGYGTQLEAGGRDAAAREAYQQALSYNPSGEEAAARLQRLQIATSVPPPSCETAMVNAAQQGLPAYTPTTGSFIRIQEQSFVLDEARFPVYGVDYYPRDTPFVLFLTQTRVDVMAAELDILKSAGINTLRIFLRYEDLFMCPGNGAVPQVENFTRLDNIIRAAASKDFKLIVVLHHDADLSSYPLYSNPVHVREQTRFLVERYRNEPTILAWDVRDRGDLDYREQRFTRETVLTWVAETALLIRQTDPNHLITAGWWEDAAATAPLVDFVSFQHYGEYEPLRQTIAILRDQVRDKPILLAAIGYSTHLLDEIAQRNLLFQSLEEISNNRLAGWVIYMAFDYPRTATCIPPACPGEEREINRYGLWNTSYFPKLAVEAVQRITGVGFPSSGQ